MLFLSSKSVARAEGWTRDEDVAKRRRSSRRAEAEIAADLGMASRREEGREEGRRGDDVGMRWERGGRTRGREVERR